MALGNGLTLELDDDIHRMLIGMVLLDGIVQLAAEVETCGICADSGVCEGHWPVEAAWTSYEHALSLIDAQTGQPPAPAGAAVAVMVAAAARRAIEGRRRSGHPLDAALAAAYDVLANYLAGAR